MADTGTTPSDTSERQAGHGRRWGRWPIVLAALASVVLLAGVLGAVVVGRRDETPGFSAVQIGWMRDGCQQWAAGRRATNPDGPSDAWCSAMAAWMDARLSNGPSGSPVGQGPMMGAAMWQSPDAMRATCEQWMRTDPGASPSGTDASAWCGQMVTWMRQHMGDGSEWMRTGPMMGGSAGTTP